MEPCVWCPRAASRSANDTQVVADAHDSVLDDVGVDTERYAPPEPGGLDAAIGLDGIDDRLVALTAPRELQRQDLAFYLRRGAPQPEEGLAGVSVGIFGESGALVGVINVSGLGQRLDEAARRRTVEHMRDVVDDIEAALRRGRRAAA
jgi:hypothetical protein